MNTIPELFFNYTCQGRNVSIPLRDDRIKVSFSNEKKYLRVTVRPCEVCGKPHSDDHKIGQ